ncbi:glycosyl hydrolase family 81-domain-containing protein [Chaetomium sp. MPI-SDFR-AT-0129]|nr:glycosyl hydrolase family 81-domain-containing protein [Chaetomium sp. MPI-SDFR-AT-0129]
MLGSLGSLLLSSAALVGALPSGSGSAPDHGSAHHFVKRAALDPISTSGADGIAGGQVACDAPPVKSFIGDLKPPFPTNSWWAPFAAPPGNATAAGPFPYESGLQGSGIQFGLSTARKFDGTSIQQPTQFDWLASFTEHQGAFENHKATAFDTQSVTVQYFEGSSTLTTYLVPGSPYITLEYDSATPSFKSLNGGIKTFNDKDLGDGGSQSATGTQFTVVDSKGTTYIIYALSEISLTATADSTASGTIKADGPFKGVLRFVQLGDASHKDLLDKHAEIYPTSVAQDYSFTDAEGTLVFTWETVGDKSQLLMLTWPHHRLTMQDANFPDTTALGYLTIKGWMYPAIGNTWTMQYELTDIAWNAPRDLDASCSDAVINGLKYEIGQLNVSAAPVPGDFYYWGGALAAQGRLALISDNLGQSDLVQPVVDYLKASFAHWFDSAATILPAYETAWGGVINKAGATNTWVDFGNGYYNDHHFHYGYFLSVAAVIAKFDKDWLSQHKDYINWFARDIINPSADDPFFPIARCRDWFAGHSWASGIANGAGSRDQESTGEAVNGYYGALLWASVALDQAYVDYARLLLATEQQAAQLYWHLYPQAGETDRDNPYPEAEVRDLVTMGNVEDWQSGAWLFWGDQKSEIAAIQILPVTPVNEVLYDKQWAENVWAYTMPELVDPAIGDEWKCVIIAAYSNSNPQVAAAWAGNLTTWGTGNTFTNELYFIGTRPNPTGEPICGTLPQNPYGTFKIQDAASGKYVAASAANTNLIASATSDADAATFDSAYVPNAGTLQLTSTKEYVTSDQSGTGTLAAIRDVASSWERFTIRPKSGGGDGVYSIKAGSNGLYVTLGSDGSLINGGKDEASAAGFKFVKV